jgi:hypothetical protein
MANATSFVSVEKPIKDQLLLTFSSAFSEVTVFPAVFSPLDHIFSGNSNSDYQ